MKAIVSLLLFTVTAGAVTTAEAAPPRTPLLAADCINTTQINDWHIIDAHTAIVRTGPKRYLVKLSVDCPQLSHPPGLIFKANQANAVVNQGRICGEVGETVGTRGRPPCPLESVSLIDKARFDQLTKDAKYYNGGNIKKAAAATH